MYVPQSFLTAGFVLSLFLFNLHAEDRVAESANQICPVLTGSKVPNVGFTKPDGSPLELAAAVSQKPTILIFYRGGW